MLMQPSKTRVTLARLDTVCPFEIGGVNWAAVRLNDGWEHGFSPGVFEFDGGAGRCYAVELPERFGAAAMKRRREFLAGRLCAADVLRRLGAPEAVRSSARVPQWPSGVAGSISHNDTRAIAVATRRFRRIGVDCEALLPSQCAHEIAGLVLTEEERSRCPAFLELETFVVLVFSAKEALYKAIYADIARTLDFRELIVTHCAHGEMQVCFEAARFLVHWRLVGAECQTLVALPHFAKGRC